MPDPDASAAAPASLAKIADRVQARIALLLDAEVERWRSFDPDLGPPLEYLRDLVLAGGKRLRPAFCHWGFVGAGGAPDDPIVIDAGAALELLHTFALVHDDVMDDSGTRRGMDAVHVAFADRHRRAGWSGDARRFGDGVAILMGDIVFVYADMALAGAPADAIRVFSELRLEVNIGQYLDLLGTVRRDATPEAAERICRYKSGKYTIERPLHLGAALAGRLAELEASLSAYGDPLGEAFQLRDDLLGAFGDASVTGKPVGEDLREGKPTLLFALARQRATGAAARLLAERFGEADLTTEEVGAIQAVMVDTGARDDVAARITRLLDAALAAVEVAPITDEARRELVDLATFVAARDY
jgi:geranylgeranyl diphosphate synthase type I